MSRESLEAEYLEATRIAVKVERSGRGSLTPAEERYYSHSAYANGGGCPSTGAAFPPGAPDPEAYKTAKMIRGVLDGTLRG